MKVMLSSIIIPKYFLQGFMVEKKRTGAKIEVFLLRELNRDARLWDVLVDPARKIRVGNKLYFKDDEDQDVLVAEVVDNTTSRGSHHKILLRWV